MNKKNSNDKKDQRKAECGDVGRSSKKNRLPKRSNVKQALRIRDPEWLSGDEDFEDYIDDSAAHPTNRPKPHNTTYIDDEFDY